jgi:hypothetical protein
VARQLKGRKGGEGGDAKHAVKIYLQSVACWPQKACVVQALDSICDVLSFISLLS